MTEAKQTPQESFWVVVPAAGVGTRMQADRPKQYLPLAGTCVLQITLENLLNHPAVEGVVVALSVTDSYWQQLSIADDPRVEVVEGGAERKDSVLNGLTRLRDQGLTNQWVMVHDAARPCVTHDDLDKLITAVYCGGQGAVLGVPVRDTMKQVDDQAVIQQTADRRHLWHAFTPQVFRLNALHDALEQCAEKRLDVTDEASAMEQCGYRPTMVEGSHTNIKITRPDDLAMAEFILEKLK